MGMGSEDENEFHVMFIPFMAPGHLIPMVGVAKLLASQGIRSTVITTPQNALSFKSILHDDDEGKPRKTMQLLTIPFPSTEVGLPEGCENLISVSTPEMNMKFLRALDFLRSRFEKVLRDSRPHCIASDYLFPWTVDIADELGVPRLAFNGSGLFNICVSHSLDKYKPHDNVVSETEAFTVPGLPDEVRLTRSQLPDIVKTKTETSPLFEKLKEAEKRSYGVLVNSFSELEPGYVEHFREKIGTKAWLLGPVSLFNKEKTRQRGEEDLISRHSCLHWLDKQKRNSVIYVCFGSLTKFNKTQTKEIAVALEESGHSFIWVLGESLNSTSEDGKRESWTVEEFERAVNKNGKGLIIRGWAPQVLLLEHEATGGFLTHCGWNSVLEGVTAGVPMVTWPLFADQFYNEKLVAEVLRIGVPVGNETWKVWATDETEVIDRTKIKRAICRVMGTAEEAMRMRRRAENICESAKNAVEEGGSSHNDLKALVEDIRSYKPPGLAENADKMKTDVKSH